VAQLDKRLLVRRPDGQTDVLADLAPLVTSPKCNELIVDGSGTAWIGSVNYDKPDDVVVRVDPGGHAEVVASGFHHTNGMAMTADGRTLLVAETFGARVTAYTICDGKTLTDGRTWAELPGTGPDGCALDSNGRLWVADAYGHRCLLVAEGGEIIGEIAPPDGLQAYACMLGGPENRTLLMCCVPGWDMDQPKDGTAASLIATEVDVPADPRSLP
jgi:sugar lactone lactonase YvrE